MEEELNLDSLEVQADEKLKVKNRFQTLSDKVATTSKERDDALAKVQAEAEAKAQLEKERDFYKDFSANVSKYPAASEFQDKILEKVKAGYATEDAMVSVLAKEGKFAPQEVKMAPITAEGGSATTTLAGDKTFDQMSVDDKRSALQEAEKTGDLERAIRGR
jgi:hypothetical protein